MSNHFTYEIDERNLRIQMKDFVVPVKEDAWQKFETFSDSMVSNSRENRLKNFNFSLNRSVVLPSVFGVIIILFSFLLVNFVSIKNPVKETEQKAEVKAEPIPTPEIKPEAKKIVPVVAEVKPDTLAKTTPIVAETKVEEIPIANTTVSNSETSTAPIITSTETPGDVASTEAKAKRKAKRRAEAVESQKLLEIRPTPATDERDSEIRPD